MNLNYHLIWNIWLHVALSIRPKLIPEILGERMKQTFSGISFRKFGCTSQGWPKILENRNNRKIPFHSTIPARA